MAFSRFLPHGIGALFSKSLYNKEGIVTSSFLTMTVSIKFDYMAKLFLTHLFPMHPFSTPWKHQKSIQFSVFRGQRKGALGINVLISDKFDQNLVNQHLYKKKKLPFEKNLIRSTRFFPEFTFNSFMREDLLCKSMYWFLYDRDHRHERVNQAW